MILWINGAFGSGKTQTSYELCRRMPHSYVYDPEQAGFYIRKNIPKQTAEEDFQHYPMWRELNYSMLSYINQRYDGTVIVPMTVTDPDYFQEMVGRLRADGVTVHHYTLIASKESLLKRLRSRGDGSGSWAARQIDRCIDGLAGDVFRHHLDTERLSVEEAAEAIAAMSDIRLQPDRRGTLRKRADRIWTQLKHIRLFH
ncbi:AAA family ATPase [Paenibacillus sp. GYB004]|uniref:AAA family ATPase n=1 Tax=Paenibacillus sp. GYB004 TaxID=2994393 RepID=UPI002F965D15